MTASGAIKTASAPGRGRLFDGGRFIETLSFLGPASRHDAIGFLYSWFSMKQFLLSQKTASATANTPEIILFAI